METGTFIIALLFLGVGIVAGVLATMVINWFGKKENTPTDSRSALYQPEANLLRDRASGRLVLELNGKILTTPQGLSADQRQKTERLALDLTRWLGFPPTPAKPAAPIAEMAPVVPVPPVPASYPSTGSIVQQINDLLQEQLAGTPLAERSIRLSDGLHQTVVVWVGSQRFEGIDAVTDPEVKTAIRAAVSEWERRAARNSPSGQ